MRKKAAGIIEEMLIIVMLMAKDWLLLWKLLLKASVSFIHWVPDELITSELTLEESQFQLP